MPLTGSRTCPQCGSGKQDPYVPLSNFHLVKCGSCGLMFTSWEPTTEELKVYYSRYTRVEDISPITLLRYEQVLDGFEAFRKTGRILETGCGAGTFLQRAAKRGWEPHGTEIGEDALGAARARGIAMTTGPLDPALYPAAHFDVVCSIEVIEHLPDPRREVANVVSVLRPGGLFYVTTPNFDCLARRLSPSDWNVASYPEHLNYFTPQTLHAMLHAEGLAKRTITTTGFSVYRWRIRRNNTAGNDRAAQEQQESLRSAMEHRPLMKLLKKLINSMLNLLRLGDSMKASYVKPAA